MSTITEEISLREWAAELEAAARIARDIAGTAFLPESHRRFYRDDHGRILDGKDGKPYRLDLEATTATAAAAIMTGAELGLKPSAALRSITVINNTPALSALALRAILQHAGHDIWVAESNSTKAVVRARRAGGSEVMAATWTIDRAKTARLYPGGEKSQWSRNPGAMLVARASAEAARWIAADAILGIPYIAEEILDELEAPLVAAVEAAIDARLAIAPAAVDGDGAAEAAPAPAPPKRRRRKPAAPPPLPTGPPAAAPADAAAIEAASSEVNGLAAAPEAAEEAVEVEVEVVDDEADAAAAERRAAEPPEVAAANAVEIPGEAVEVPAATRDQMAKLHAGLREIGVTEKDEALGLISAWAGRTVESTKELTGPEVSTVLDRIDALRTLGARKIDEEAGGNEPA